MNLFVCGINHEVAPLALREQCAIGDAQVSDLLGELLELSEVTEVMVLSTCNRTEIIGMSPANWAMTDWMASYFKLEPHQFPSYCYDGYEAVVHMMQVASGLNSMVLGEPEILGQLKQAYQLAVDYKAVGKHLGRLLPAVFAASKHVRTHTDIGKCVLSMPQMTANLIYRHYDDLAHLRVLLLGASEINEQVLKVLSGLGCQQISVMSRSIAKAQALASRYQVRALKLQDLQAELDQADVVISATSASYLIVTMGMIESALLKKNSERLVIDLAMPRDIEPAIARMSQVNLYNLDDIQHLIDTNQASREGAALLAKQMVIELADEFLQQVQLDEHAKLISKYREQAEFLRVELLEKAKAQLDAGADSKAVCELLSKKLTARLLHHPTVGLRTMIANSDNETLQCLADKLEEIT